MAKEYLIGSGGVWTDKALTMPYHAKRNDTL